MPPPDTSSDWPCTWEAHELEQLKHGMRMTFRQKMQWLEDTSDFAKKLQSAPTRTLKEAQAAYAEENARKEQGKQPENTSA